MRIATRQDWKTLSMPAESEKIAFHREYSKQEFERLRAGWVPEEMEDKWVIYFEDPFLYLHRSWTGICVYRVRFDQSETRARVVEAVVNRRLDQYRCTDDEGGWLGVLLDVRAGRDTEAATLDLVRNVRHRGAMAPEPARYGNSLINMGLAGVYVVLAVTCGLVIAFASKDTADVLRPLTIGLALLATVVVIAIRNHGH